MTELELKELITERLHSCHTVVEEQQDNICSPEDRKLDGTTDEEWDDTLRFEAANMVKETWSESVELDETLLAEIALNELNVEWV